MKLSYNFTNTMGRMLSILRFQGILTDLLSSIGRANEADSGFSLQGLVEPSTAFALVQQAFSNETVFHFQKLNALLTTGRKTRFHKSIFFTASV